MHSTPFSDALYSPRLSLRELIQGMIMEVWLKLGENDDDRWQTVVSGDVNDDIAEPFYEAMRTVLGSDAAITVVAEAEAQGS